MPENKSYEEHLRFLHETVRLHLFYLWTWLRNHPGEDFAAALRQRVDLYRKTDINDGFANGKIRRYDDPRWIRLERELAAQHEKYRNDETAGRFEAACFHIVRPLVDARSRRDYEEPPEAMAFGYKCGSLDYDPPPPQNPRRVFIHIANAVVPCSIFDDPQYLQGCFAALVRQCRERFNADRIESITWLNSYPRWLAHLPNAWHDHLGPELRDVDGGFGFWGQFMTARGTFHDKRAQHLRDTGQFPYWPRHSWCLLADIEQAAAEDARSTGPALET